MELLRPAVLGCCDSLGVHWSGAWSHSVRGFPWVEVHTAEETAPGGANPAWLARLSAWCPRWGSLTVDHAFGQGPQLCHSVPDCHRSFPPALGGAEPLALCAPHVAALTASTSSTIPHRSDCLLLIHNLVPLGLARRPPLQHGQTSPPRVPRTWSCQPSRAGPTRCRLLCGMRVPSTHGKPLAGCLGAQSATMPPTSGLPDCHMYYYKGGNP